MALVYMQKQYYLVIRHVWGNNNIVRERCDATEYVQFE